MRILFLTGPHAVGKSHLMNELSQKTKFFTFDTGPHMRAMHKSQAPELSIGEWVDGLEAKYGPLITCDMLCKEFEKEYEQSENVIITGFRQIEGILYMIDYFKPDDYEVLYLDADIQLLKKNYEEREKVYMSEDDFKNYIKSEEDWGLLTLKKWVLSNMDKSQYISKKTNSDPVQIRIFEESKLKELRYDE